MYLRSVNDKRDAIRSILPVVSNSIDTAENVYTGNYFFQHFNHDNIQKIFNGKNIDLAILQFPALPDLETITDTLKNSMANNGRFVITFPFNAAAVFHFNYFIHDNQSMRDIFPDQYNQFENACNNLIEHFNIEVKMLVYSV